MNWNRSSLSAIFAPAPFASFRHASLKRALPAIAKARARASYAYASGKSSIPPSSQISRERWAWYSAGSGRRSNAYTWEICHSPIAASFGPPTTLQWYREAYAIWIMRSSSSFVRFFFAIKSHVELNNSAAIFRCHCLSDCEAIRPFPPGPRQVGLGRFELPSQAPKARRIDQATPQPRRREVPDALDKYVLSGLGPRHL